MESLSAIIIGSTNDAKRWNGAIVFDLFIGAGFACDRAVRSYILWNVFKKTEYDVFYLPWSNTGTD
jgi:hypothetical protein